ncbi:MAG TPA: cytochrome c family protein [Alphaproteobacteria bacterium]|nr:cytochrome c family protein [Alphaproteobacteria bacterium]
MPRPDFSISALVLLATLTFTFSTHAADTPEPIVGDAPHGSLLFSTRCSMCHSFDGNKYGPSMHGVYGRKAGTVDGYEYSEALKGAPITWNEMTLDKWLDNPDALAHGTKMTTKVPNVKDRADLIAYLKSLQLPTGSK